MDKKCPIYQMMGFLGKRWTILILVELYKGRKRWKRYSEIKNRVPGMTPKILSSRLKELGREGMVKRRADARRFPIKAEYSLTGRGEEFVDIMKNIKTWGLRWKVRNEYCERVDCKECSI
jgi:DNA-binding HxlR family transcriptional regulator